LLFVQLVVSGILLGGVYALISVGLTLIFGVMRVINFAHGEFLMLALYASYWLFHLWTVQPYVGLLIVPPVAFVAGLVIFIGLIAPAMRRGPSSQLFVTMGLSMLLTNLALFFWKADFRSIAIPLSGSHITVGAIYVPVTALVAFGVAILATLALWAFLAFTHIGRAIRATAQDPGTAELMGVNIRVINTLTFGLGTALVALAGPVLSPIYPVFPMVGLHMVAIAFVVVVLGGLGSVPGAWLGGLLMGVVDAFAGFYFPTAFKDTIFFVVFLAMLVLRPSGILGVRGAEEIGLK
jgi:branched-chain amino acid transport system permease protein